MAAIREKKIIAQNRRARHDFFISEVIEAGIVLLGSEVKSMRQGKANLNDAFAENREGVMYLINLHIEEYKGANQFNHEPRRPRQLLLHAREINKLSGAVQRKGYTLIPLSLYFNKRGIAKVELGLGKGKKLHDKRASEKEKDWNREKGRILKGE